MKGLLPWIQACRPKTLVASFVPICVAFKNTFSVNEPNLTSIGLTIGCLFFIILIQVSTNLANDFYDGLKGVDNNRFNALKRFVSSGELCPDKVFLATKILLILSFIVGLLVMHFSDASKWLVVVGVICIILSIVYTGGPYPLAYNGLGDIFVILFFGFVSIELTKYILCVSNNYVFEFSFILSISVGLLINNLLIINNYRDYENDLIYEKKTTIVKFGKRFGKIFFLASLCFPALYSFCYDKYLVLTIIPIGLFSLHYLTKEISLKNSNISLSLSSLNVLVFGLFC